MLPLFTYHRKNIMGGIRVVEVLDCLVFPPMHAIMSTQSNAGECKIATEAYIKTEP